MSWFEKLFGNDISIRISIFSSCCNEIKDEVKPEIKGLLINY